MIEIVAELKNSHRLCKKINIKLVWKHVNEINERKNHVHASTAINVFFNFYYSYFNVVLNGDNIRNILLNHSLNTHCKMLTLEYATPYLVNNIAHIVHYIHFNTFLFFESYFLLEVKPDHLWVF